MLASLCVLALVAPQSSAPRPELAALNPVQVSNGPLLVFTRHETPHGEPDHHGFGDGLRTLYVFDPSSDRAAAAVHRWNTWEDSVRRMERCTRDQVVFERRGRVCALDLSTGRIESVVSTINRNRIAEVRGSRVFVLEERMEGPDRMWLHARDLESTLPAQRLTEFDFAALVTTDERGYTLATSAPNRRLLWLRRDGAYGMLSPLDERWDHRQLQLCESPDGKHLAIVGTRTSGGAGRRDLAVVEIATQRVVLARENLPCHAPRLWGAHSRLWIAWESATTLRHFDLETEHLIDVTTGEVLNAPPLGQSHDLRYEAELGVDPTVWKYEPREYTGWLETRGEKLYYRSETEPVEAVDILGPWPLIHGGRFALVAAGGGGSVRVLDGKLRKIRFVMEGRVEDPQWLAAPAE